ncbi:MULTISPECIES: glycosyltransferase [Thermomonospora]|uniref:Glycosyl transferase group 1 n=1 Tax=Thermomonospora curvata (strain ATCC 19995 / DSM 43183 / JCM 3096 / KCTC 9072 / NBRC 15933 / NCIMB 10081 / Henssen B9) TaxID=471852 RepID=D1A998_THECD|nr:MULTISPECIES: glycosyltransferase [Thermomonospora]ACY96794.1 glycosyl transferase group 1 [Thermomonospora curvata DSM 43183]PKK15347.1 MAG: glycosyltransferase family 4 protein [Thermomonospora sp. CIF 1]
MTGRDIFIVCNTVDDLGGVQRWAHRTAELLTGRGHRVTLVGIARSAEPHPRRPRAPYRVVTLHGPWRPPALAWRPASAWARLNVRARLRDRWRTAVQRRGAERLAALLRAARPGGVVIVAQVWAMEWVRLAGTGGLKVIAMSHESYQAARASSRYRRIWELYPSADRMLTLTAEDADAWARAGMTNVDHMPNPLPFSPAARADLDAPVVACLGRLSHEKGVDMALEAWAEASAAHPGWRLRIHGSGPEEEALRAQARALGIAGTVEFCGPAPDAAAALAQASVFLLPSRQEGLPMSLMEAMACGLPAVAFDCAPGVRELLTDEVDGLLVPPGHVPALAAALRRLMGDGDLRRKLGDNAVAGVRRLHPDTVLDRWERLLELLHRDEHDFSS